VKKMTGIKARNIQNDSDTTMLLLAANYYFWLIFTGLLDWAGNARWPITTSYTNNCFSLVEFKYCLNQVKFLSCNEKQKSPRISWKLDTCLFFTICWFPLV
jgi:hypothetical protein